MASCSIWAARLQASVDRCMRCAQVMLCAAVVFTTGSCRETTAPPSEHGTAASLDVVAGDLQDGIVGTELAAPLVARVLDANGQPIAGQLMNFRVVRGGGSVFAGSAMTNVDGEARERWTLGTSTADSQTVEARAIDNTTGAPLVFGVFRATARAAAPDTVRVLSGDGQSASAGSRFADSLVVRVADRYGNPVPGTTVTFSAPAAAGTLGRTSDVTTALGRASTALTAGLGVGAYTITASVASRTASFTESVTAAQPARLIAYAGDGQTGIVNTRLPIDPAIQVFDVNGNPAVGVPVQFNVNVGGPVGATTVNTDAGGIARTSWTCGAQAGPNSLIVSVTGVGQATFTAIGVAGPPTQIYKDAGDGQTAPPGATLPVRPTVWLRDQFSNSVAGAHVTFAVTAGGGSITANDVVTDNTGRASVAWTLGAAPATNQLTASADGTPTATFTATGTNTSPDLTVNIGNRPYDVYYDSILVVADVFARYPLQSVTATISGRTVNLTNQVSATSWRGTISLIGLPTDTLEIVVTARDANGTRVDAVRKILHFTHPTLVISGVEDGTVARPSITFTADCTDSGAPCTSLTLTASAQTFASGTSHIGGTVSLAAYDGYPVTLTFTGRGTRNQPIEINRVVYVESSSRLSTIATTPGMAVDLRGDRILYQGPRATVGLQTISSGATQTIPVDTIGSGFVTPAGAIFINPSFPTSLSEWRNGTLTSLGPVDNYTLFVEGAFAVFNSGGTVTRRDLTAGTNVVIGGALAPAYVAANGDFVYGGSDRNVYRYRGGLLTTLTQSATGEANDAPFTDGVNVVWRNRALCCGTAGILFHDGTAATTLAPQSTQNVSPPTSYLANNGWTAFTKPDANNVMQVWTRSPAGALFQVTSYVTESLIRGLGADGTVIFENGTRRYLVSPGGAPRDLMGTTGTVLWRDGRFVVLIGRTAFSVTP